MDSLGFTWTHLDSLGSFGFTWIHLDSPGFTGIHLVSLGLIWIHLDTSFKNYTLEQVQDLTLQERHTEIREIYNDGRITTDIFIKHLEMREQMIKVKMFLTETNKQ